MFKNAFLKKGTNQSQFHHYSFLLIQLEKKKKEIAINYIFYNDDIEKKKSSGNFVPLQQIIPKNVKPTLSSVLELIMTSLTPFLAHVLSLSCIQRKYDSSELTI